MFRSPYTQKAIHDAQFREYAFEALLAGKQAYRRLNKKGSGVLNDRKFKRSVRDAKTSLVAARSSGRSGKGKWILILAVLGAAGWLRHVAGARTGNTPSDSSKG